LLWDARVADVIADEIVGEALAQLARLDAAMAARIPDLREIVGFRSVLIRLCAHRSRAHLAGGSSEPAATPCGAGGALNRIELLTASRGHKECAECARDFSAVWR
jgi:hypothetical protein